MKRFFLLTVLFYTGFASAETPTTKPQPTPSTQPWIGLRLLDYTSTDNPKQAAQVESIDHGSPASNLRRNDLITLWDGKTIHSKADMDKLLRSAVIGKSYMVGILRPIGNIFSTTPPGYKYFEFRILVSSAPLANPPQTVIVKQEIAEINDPFRDGQHVGTIGRISGLHIQQIIDENNCLANLCSTIEVNVPQPAVSGALRVDFRLPAQNTMIVPIESRPVWIKGIKTSGLVDDQVICSSIQSKQYDIRIAVLFELTGTKTYQTGIGTNTTFIIEPKNVDSPTTSPTKH